MISFIAALRVMVAALARHPTMVVMTGMNIILIATTVMLIDRANQTRREDIDRIFAACRNMFQFLQPLIIPGDKR